MSFQHNFQVLINMANHFINKVNLVINKVNLVNNMVHKIMNMVNHVVNLINHFIYNENHVTIMINCLLFCYRVPAQCSYCRCLQSSSRRQLCWDEKGSDGDQFLA